MVERWTKTKRHEVCEHPPSNPHLQKRDNKHEFFIGIIHIKIYDLPMCISNTRDIEPFIPSLRILHRSITNHSNWSLNRHTYEIIVHICLYIKSKNTVVLNDRVKKKKKSSKGRLIRSEVFERRVPPLLVHHPKIRCQRCFAIFVSFSREAKQ